MLRVDGVVYKSSVLQQSLMHQLQLIEVGQVEHFEDGGEPQQEASANRDLVGETIYADARYPGFLFIETEDEIKLPLPQIIVGQDRPDRLSDARLKNWSAEPTVWTALYEINA